MNKWVKRGLLLGAGYIATKQAVKWINKKDYVDQLMKNLKKVDEYKELRDMLMQVLDSFSGQRRVETNTHTEEQPAPDVEADESIADAVKSVLDTKLVSELIPDQKDVDMIKDVIDEAAKVEKLVRDWLK